MDVLPILVSLVLVVLTAVIAYVKYMGRHFKVFQQMGIQGPTPKSVFGNLQEILADGYIQFHLRYSKLYENEKAYGYFEGGQPFLAIRDPDMIRDISIKNFSSFVNRRVFFDGGPFATTLTNIKDDHWKRVRSFVSPAFTSGKLKRMSVHVEETAGTLVSNLREYSRANQEIELNETVYGYAMDVIASTGFGVKTDSLKSRNHPFVVEASKVMNGFGNTFIGLMLFCPGLAKFVDALGFSGFPKDSVKFFRDFVNDAIANRSQDESSHKRTDFLQMMINAEESPAESDKDSNSIQPTADQNRLTREEIQGQAFIFITATYENLTKTVSFTLFLLAHHPDCCRKVQEELDQVLDGKPPGYESLQELTYLDMCLNETMRMYPPGYQFDRVCNEDCTVQGVRIPKGVNVMLPAITIHRDPKFWPEPEKFDPERFSAEQKANRHPFAHLPFGQGPRNCVGMRLALVQVKTVLATILQEMTPVPSEKSVYPITLEKHQMRAVHGMWVKFVPRQP